MPGLPDRLLRCAGHPDRDPAAGHPAAPSLPVVRAGRRVHPLRRGRPECRRDQADRVSHRRELGADGSADRGRAAGQGSDRRGRADGALRRGGEHQLGRAAGARRRAGGLRRVRPEDAREALAADPSRKRPRRRVAPRALRASGHGQLSSAHHPPLHGLRPADGRPGHLRRRERGLPAHHEPGARRAHEAAAAGAVHDAPPRAGNDPARDPQCEGGQARADRRQDERAGRGGRDPRALRGVQRRREGRPDRPRRVLAAARACRGCRRTSACARSSGASSSTTASGISPTTAMPTSGSRRPTGWAATCSAASRSRSPCAIRSCASASSTRGCAPISPTTSTRGSCMRTASGRR